MKIAPFLVEEWMNAYETKAKYNIAETCVNSLSLREVLALAGENEAAFTEKMMSGRLTYGAIEGRPAFLSGIAKLYKTVQANEVIPTHGAAGANHHVFTALISAGDHVISIMPTYQQLYSIPASIGADVSILELRKEDGYLPDVARLKALCRPDTKMICINNPNNPTGALMNEAQLREIVEIARSCGAYLLCDEVYRHLTQTDEYSPSVADLYEKGISVSSMSKVFSLAGIRLGWMATHDEAARRAFLSRRDYNLISCGMLDEMIAETALANGEKILARNRKIVRENLALLDGWMKNHPQLSWVKPEAGTTAFVYYDDTLSSREFCTRLLMETGALVTPGECFGYEKCFRIGYACGNQELREGLAAMDRFLKKREQERA